jgi:hypothetical protein
MTSYRIHGMTDDTDTCEVCGKRELRRVVMLAVLDADGNAEEIIYAGTTCAARKLAQRGKSIRAGRIADAAAAAARLMDNARDWANIDANCTLNQYIAANCTALLNANNHDTAAALTAAKTGYADMRREAELILSGTLAATRFEKHLPTL